MTYKGINNDSIINKLPEEEYFFAKNIVLTDQYNSVTNEDGNTKIYDGIKPAIGKIVVGKHFIYFSGEGTESEIGVVYNNYYIKCEDPNNILPNLNFNKNYFIIGEYSFNFKGDCIIAFTDNFNVPRSLNIGQLSNPIIQEKTIEETRLFLNTFQPIFNIEVINSGGSLFAGSYQFAIRYIDSNNNRSNVSLLSNAVWFGDDSNLSNDLNYYDGSPVNKLTSKSIRVTVNNINQDYKEIEYIVLSKLNNQFIGSIFAKVEITQSQQSVIYSGLESSTSISFNEITIGNISYTKAKAITQLNNRLYIGNLETTAEIEYQEYANNIRLKWYATPVLKSEANKINFEKGFQHGEVYAFYIAFIMEDGSLSRAFHIPGRPYRTSDTGFTTSDLVYSIGSPYKYQIEDTSTVTSTSPLEGEFGYWQNLNEKYPTEGNFPTSGSAYDSYNSVIGQYNNVRHHKFPSLYRTLPYFAVNNNQCPGRNLFPKLGVKVENVQNIPNNAQGWVLLYAERNSQNSTVVDQGLWYYAGIHENRVSGGAIIGDSSVEGFGRVNTTGGNFALSNLIQNTPFLYIDNEVSNRTDYIRFNGFYMLKYKPFLSDIYVENLFYYRCNNTRGSLNIDTFNNKRF